MEAREAALFGSSEPVRAFILDDWSLATFDLARDTAVVLDPGGEIAAYGQLSTHDPMAFFEAWVNVHPRCEGRGIGAALMRWTEAKAAERLPAGASSAVRNGVASVDERARSLLSGAGYSHVRSFWQMTIEVGDGVALPPDPEGVVIRPYVDPDDDRGLYETMETAFATHFGYREETFEEWIGNQRGFATWDPSLLVIAEAAGGVVGGAINFLNEDGVGWVGELGVRPAWQRRGIGRALLRRSFADFSARGSKTVRLGVDTENESGAVGLYRSVGMSPFREWCVYETRVSRD